MMLDATRILVFACIQGESSWQPPESWKIRPSEMWVRNKDDRDNIYYYNMQVRVSVWLCGFWSDEVACLEVLRLLTSIYTPTDGRIALVGAVLHLRRQRGAVLHRLRHVLLPRPLRARAQHRQDARPRVVQPRDRKGAAAAGRGPLLRVQAAGRQGLRRPLLAPPAVPCPLRPPAPRPSLLSTPCPASHPSQVMCTTCWDPYCAECFRYARSLARSLESRFRLTHPSRLLVVGMCTTSARCGTTSRSTTKKPSKAGCASRPRSRASATTTSTAPPEKRRTKSPSVRRQRRGTRICF